MALDTMTALDADGLPTTINKIKSGRAAAVDSQAVVISTEDLAAIAAVGTKLDSVISLVGATNTALAATNSALNTLDGRVDGLEGLLTTANAALYAEDAAHASGAAGRVALGVRKDTAASLAGTDGDYTAHIFDASGRQHVNVGVSVLPTGAAEEATLVDLLASSEAVEALLATTPTELPKRPLMTTSDLTAGNVSRSGAGETIMVSATSSQTTRLHRYAVTVPGAGTIEIRDGTGGTAQRKHIFPAAGGLAMDFWERPYAKTTANTALYFYWSGSGDANIDFDYIKSA